MIFDNLRSIVGFVLTEVGMWVTPDPPSHYPAYESNEALDGRE